MTEVAKKAEKRRFSSLARIVPIASAIALGVVIGSASPATGAFLAPFGGLYLSLLLMCIIPIIGAAVISSLGRMVANHRLGKNLLIIAIVFWVGMFLAAAIGTGIGWVSRVGEDLQMSPALGDLLLRMESTGSGGMFDDAADGGASEGRYVELFDGTDEPRRAASGRPSATAGGGGPRFLTYLNKLIPGNLMVAYLEDNYLAVLFFSVLLGVALGFAPAKTRDPALSVVEALFDSLLRIITWIIWLLPAGLVCIVAGEVARGGLAFIPVFRKVVVVSLVTTVVIMALFTLTIWRVSRVSIGSVLRGLREPLIVAFATSSSFASIPSALVALKENFGLDRQSVNLFLPLGITMNPIGSALFFSLSSIFAVQLHDSTHLLRDPVNLLLFITGAVLAGIAAMGLPGPSAVWMLSIVLEPIGVPPEVGIVALLAVSPIIDPLFTMVNVFGNCTATCVLDRYLSGVAAAPVETADG